MEKILDICSTTFNLFFIFAILCFPNSKFLFFKIAQGDRVEIVVINTEGIQREFTELRKD